MMMYTALTTGLGMETKYGKQLGKRRPLRYGQHSQVYPDGLLAATPVNPM